MPPCEPGITWTPTFLPIPAAWVVSSSHRLRFMPRKLREQPTDTRACSHRAHAFLIAIDGYDDIVRDMWGSLVSFGTARGRPCIVQLQARQRHGCDGKRGMKKANGGRHPHMHTNVPAIGVAARYGVKDPLALAAGSPRQGGPRETAACVGGNVGFAAGNLLQGAPVRLQEQEGGRAPGITA